MLNDFEEKIPEFLAFHFKDETKVLYGSFMQAPMSTREVILQFNEYDDHDFTQLHFTQLQQIHKIKNQFQG